MPVIYSVLDAVRLAANITEPTREGVALIFLDEHGQAINPIIRIEPLYGDAEELLEHMMKRFGEPRRRCVAVSIRWGTELDAATEDVDKWSTLVTAALRQEMVLVDWLVLDSHKVTSFAKHDLDLGLPDRWTLLAPKGVDT